MLNPILNARVPRFFPCPQLLETRLMLSVSPVDVDDTLLRFDAGHTDGNGTMLEDDDWVANNEDLLTEAIEEVLQADQVGENASETTIPAIPFDDSFSPVTECPDLQDEFCLPGDASSDGAVDFLDFLLLNENFGLENADWEDGDLNGDGQVTFDDLLILSANFGATA